jgi:hypothetical protein
MIYKMIYKIDLAAQVKMALHATKHGLSDNQVHGIVLGRTVNSDDGDGGDGWRVTDVVPVCHEAPTKPIVDMALRLVDAHLSQSRSPPSEGGVRILGWYTANANANCDADAGGGDGETETPNPSACRIASSVAECRENDDGYDRDDFVLLLVSTSRLVNCVESLHRATTKEGDPKEPRRRSLPICTVFERSSRPGGAFAQRVDEGCVTTSTSDGGTEDGCARALAEAVARQLGYDKDDGGYVYDFVDHLEDYESGEDWIENGLVNSLFATLG